MSTDRRQPVRVAAVDCGTNSIRLLVAEVGDDGELSDVVRRRMADLASALGVAPSAGAVLSVPMPSPQAAVAARAAALAQGVTVGCFRPPSVPDGVSRLRVTVGAGVSEADWGRAVDVLVAVVKEHA